MKSRNEKKAQIFPNKELEQKMKRRKDTPALNTLSVVPDVSEKLLQKFDAMEKQQNKLASTVHKNKEDLRKPRRKDTPVINTAPILPGHRLVKEGRRTIIPEDKE
ncbi:hypothetical protein GDO86_011503 [Hymenochirus boettgeri]|uniref:Uncharacterized protein n=1 Tax=Hymenochirus boettgeri TaxID=247094 RepID=A0A8T2JJR2_9PIPI|nr:hypothetical protein GDO86_011503 [Hymenochirus boettgeri]